MKIVGIVILLVTIIFLGKYYFSSKFKTGNCIEALDGYVWHVNRYSLGKYSVMGWQNPWWGSEVIIEKSILERKNLTKIPEYHQVDCPKPKN